MDGTLVDSQAHIHAAMDQAVMIGDTEFDIAMGKAAGMATIGVAWGYHPVKRLAAAGAGRIVADFDALQAMLEEFAPEVT